MKRLFEMKYIVTDFVCVPVCRILKKSDAYKQATADGMGTVYTDTNGVFVCGEDESATLINSYGDYCCIAPCEPLDHKKWFKQAECDIILLSDSCGLCFWESKQGLVKIYITRDARGFIDTYRITTWDDIVYDNEVEISFNELSDTELYN